MNDVLSLIRIANISNMSIVQEIGRRDPLTACLVFHVSEAEISTLTQLSRRQLYELVEGVGQACLFPPRADLMSIIPNSENLAKVLTAGRVNLLYEIRQ